MANIVEQSVITVLRQVPDYRNKKFLLGYSAGLDSTALLHSMVAVRSAINLQFTAVFFSHINSELNEGEDRNEELAKTTCEALGVAYHHVVINMACRGKLSPEQYGREQRLAYARSCSHYFVTGHHADDQLETTLIQLFRGAGKSCLGMKEVDDSIVRPLLSLRKDQLREYLVNRGLVWLDDPTNANNDFTRNFWRNEVIPLLRSHYPGLTATVSTIRDKMTLDASITADVALADLGADKPMVSPSRCFNAIRSELNNSGIALPFSFYKKLVDNWGKRETAFTLKGKTVRVSTAGVLVIT